MSPLYKHQMHNRERPGSRNQRMKHEETYIQCMFRYAYFSFFFHNIIKIYPILHTKNARMSKTSNFDIEPLLYNAKFLVIQT